MSATHSRFFALLSLAALMAGCSALTPRADVLEPTTARPMSVIPAPQVKPANGSIFASAVTYRPLFEDARARGVGDVLVIRIEERINASQTNNTNIQRSANSAVELPLVNGFPGIKTLQGLGLEGSSNNRLQSRGATAATNILTGTLAVSVVEVLPNGNLIVSGEKQIGTNRELEKIRFSGVVNPATIAAGNTVSSTQVADARVEYRGDGAIDAAQTVGWLTRFFFSVLPI